jgi:hypothetical protein
MISGLAEPDRLNPTDRPRPSVNNRTTGPSALIQTKDAASIICLDRKCTKFKSLFSDDCIQGRTP